MKHGLTLAHDLPLINLKLRPVSARAPQEKTEPGEHAGSQVSSNPEEFSNLLSDMASPVSCEAKSSARPDTDRIQSVKAIGSSQLQIDPEVKKSPASSLSLLDPGPLPVLPARSPLNTKLASPAASQPPRIQNEGIESIEVDVPILTSQCVHIRKSDEVLADAKIALEDLDSEPEDSSGGDVKPVMMPSLVPIPAAQPAVLASMPAMNLMPRKEPKLGETIHETRTEEVKDIKIEPEGDARQAPETLLSPYVRRNDHSQRHEESQARRDISPLQETRREWPALIKARVETSFVPSAPSSPAIQLFSQIIEASAPVQYAKPALPARANPQGDVVKTLRFSLRPEHLGGVMVAMRMRGGELELKVEVETVEAHARLSEDQATIKQILTDAGYAVAEASIVLMPVPDQLTPQRLVPEARPFDQATMSGRNFDGGQGGQRQEAGHARTWRTDEAKLDLGDAEPGNRGGMFL
jgi:Flagellar hook-length control protein FliK